MKTMAFLHPYRGSWYVYPREWFPNKWYAQDWWFVFVRNFCRIFKHKPEFMDLNGVVYWHCDRCYAVAIADPIQ